MPAHALLPLVLAAGLAAAEPPVLVLDVGRTPVTASSSPKLQARLGDWVYFAASDPFHGEELWRTDGTAEGTERVADLCPGPCGSSPQGITALAGRIFFSANDGSTGRELWVSDGTRAGTRLTRDVCRISCDGIPAESATFSLSLAELGGEVFFAAANSGLRLALWKTDGTREGTVEVSNVSPEGPLLPFAGTLVFSTQRSSPTGYELWTSDGTREGTRRLAALSDVYNYSLEIVAASEDHLMLKTEALGRKHSLWLLGRAGAAHLIRTPCFEEDCGFVNGVFLGDTLVFGTSTLTGLWRLDLTTRKITKLNLFQVWGLREIRVLGGKALFASWSGDLWVTDGTFEGSRRLADFSSFSSGPRELTLLGDRLFFSAATEAAGRELWTSDGTPEGTRLLRDGVPGSPSSSPAGLLPLGEHLLFAASTPEAGTELWRTDGTGEGTVLLKDLAGDPGSSAPAGLAVWKDHLYFGVRPSLDAPWEAWRTDGTQEGTAPLQAPGAPRLLAAKGLFGPAEAALYPAGTVNPFDFTPFVDRLFFSADVADELPGGQVWKTDGTPEGTLELPGSQGFASSFTAAGRDLFLVGNPLDAQCSFGGPSDCGELLAVDRRNADSVRLVRDVNPSQEKIPLWPLQDVGSQLHSFVPLGSRVVFAADNGLTGAEIWASDGSEAGTLRLATLCSGFQFPSILSVSRLGSRAVFTTSCWQMWRTDGTPDGTVLLRNLPDLVRSFAVSGDRAFFLMPPGSHGTELWATDGTPEGTVRVSDLALGGTYGYARRLAAVDGRVFFTAFHEATGEELWTSDGTPGGTRLVADLRPGPDSSAPQAFAAIDGRLVFAATDGVSGLEPWVSDGTAAGTWRLADVAPGPDASSPDRFTTSGGRLYFAASDPAHGRELWAIPLSTLERARCRPTDTALCLLGGRFEVAVRWKTGEGEGVGHAVLRSDQTGLFWFFDEGNTELLVKMLDGGPVNGHSWFFSGALSDVEYWVDVRDVATGTVRTYHNPQGSLCGRVDTQAFPPAPEPAVFTAPLEASPQPLSPVPSCNTSPESLCLGGRFRVHATFKNPLAGNAETFAKAIPGSGDTGYFWFFDEANFELAVKVLDGTPVNGKRWVFWGALSDVEYTVTVIDTETGNRKEYRNPRGRICGGADTSAF